MIFQKSSRILCAPSQILFGLEDFLAVLTFDSIFAVGRQMSFQATLADCFVADRTWDLWFVQSHVSVQEPDFLSTNRTFDFLGMSQFMSLQIFFECSLEVAVVAAQVLCLEMDIFQMAFQNTAV